MGEVYRATDTKLGREVAIKVLPADVAGDAERLARFEREAKLLAALSHTGIAHLYGFEAASLDDGDTVRFIVMELVEGEDLEERLRRGPLTVDESVAIAKQIAGALEVAHEKGIVHRDLKPGNVKVTADSRVKVLDFGLAKAWGGGDAGSGPGAPALSQSPTLAHTGTAAGLILGTAAYMAPEQARAQPVDKRTDVWAFGVVLYEMLSGRRLFKGETVSDVLAAVLTREPDWTALPATTPTRLRRLLERCLERDVSRRLRDIGEARIALDELATRPDEPPASLPASSARLSLALAILLVLATLGLAWALLARPHAPAARRTVLSVLPPENASFAGLALSPDGRQFAFTAATRGNVRLWIRALDSSEARVLDGTDGAMLPFWSPDSRAIGFFSGGKLKRIDAAGGVVSTLCDVGLSVGGTWGRDGVILFGSLGGRGLARVPASGGAVSPVLAVDFKREETDLANPFFLPDGRHFLYNIYSGQKESFGVFVGSLDGGLRQRLVSDHSSAVYAETRSGKGFLLFVRNDALVAQPFDAAALRLTGDVIPIAAHVGASLDSMAIGVGRRGFSASNNGVLVFDPLASRLSRRLLWMDREGRPSAAPGGMDDVRMVRLAPDGRRFAFDRVEGGSSNGDIWISDMAGNVTRLTFDPANDTYPLWSPDGSRIVWASNRDGIYQLYEKSASGSGRDTLLLRSDLFKFPSDWSHDGRVILYRQVDPRTQYDVWVLPLDRGGAGKPYPFLKTEANEAAAALSPDGRWIAYASDESERYEIYVQSFPAGGGKRQVSSDGGIAPQWRDDGGELFYHALDGRLMAATVQPGPTFAAAAPKALFEFRPSGPLITPYYAVAPGGRRFLVSTIVDTAPGAPLTVVLNWTAAAER